MGCGAFLWYIDFISVFHVEHSIVFLRSRARKVTKKEENKFRNPHVKLTPEHKTVNAYTNWTSLLDLFDLWTSYIMKTNFHILQRKIPRNCHSKHATLSSHDNKRLAKLQQNNYLTQNLFEAKCHSFSSICSKKLCIFSKFVCSYVYTTVNTTKFIFHEPKIVYFVFPGHKKSRNVQCNWCVCEWNSWTGNDIEVFTSKTVCTDSLLS